MSDGLELVETEFDASQTSCQRKPNFDRHKTHVRMAVGETYHTDETPDPGAALIPRQLGRRNSSTTPESDSATKARQWSILCSTKSSYFHVCPTCINLLKCFGRQCAPRSTLCRQTKALPYYTSLCHYKSGVSSIDICLHSTRR